jgi:SAM-dependent methyltransferase
MNKQDESIAKSLDIKEIELLQYIPYILQDLFELGSDPEIISCLIKDYVPDGRLKILDLGCGKGAVSIKLASELDCFSKGIDAVQDFIDEAVKYAGINGVSEKCKFEKGDIRLKINENRDYNVIILGAIGPVFGDIYQTLNTLKSSLSKGGYVVLDDGYLKENSKINYAHYQREKDFYNLIEKSGFTIIEEVIFLRNFIEDKNRTYYLPIEKRINELVKKYPEKKYLFLEYLKAQEKENYILENELVTGTWLLKSIK